MAHRISDLPSFRISGLLEDEAREAAAVDEVQAPALRLRR